MLCCQIFAILPSLGESCKLENIKNAAGLEKIMIFLNKKNQFLKI